MHSSSREKRPANNRLWKEDIICSIHSKPPSCQASLLLLIPRMNKAIMPVKEQNVVTIVAKLTLVAASQPGARCLSSRSKNSRQELAWSGEIQEYACANALESHRQREQAPFRSPRRAACWRRLLGDELAFASWNLTGRHNGAQSVQMRQRSNEMTVADAA